MLHQGARVAVHLTCCIDHAASLDSTRGAHSFMQGIIALTPVWHRTGCHLDTTFISPSIWTAPFAAESAVEPLLPDAAGHVGFHEVELQHGVSTHGLLQWQTLKLLLAWHFWHRRFGCHADRRL